MRDYKLPEHWDDTLFLCFMICFVIAAMKWNEAPMALIIAVVVSAVARP